MMFVGEEGDKYQFGRRSIPYILSAEYTDDFCPPGLEDPALSTTLILFGSRFKSAELTFYNAAL
jgi:hypothetical protein